MGRLVSHFFSDSFYCGDIIMSHLLEVSGLTYYHPSASSACLKEINLVVEKGDFIVISGLSGCGKTTLIKCINGISPHVTGGKMEGTIFLEGKDITGLPPEERSIHIGTVFQDFDSQITQVTVEDELAFGPENLALPREEIRRRVNQVAEKISLRLTANPISLSGGNRQRLCIGGALSMQPSVLLLDEPLSNLDSDGVKALCQFTEIIRQKGTAVIMIEHRIDLIKNLADKIFFIENGQLYFGPAQEINLDLPPHLKRNASSYPREVVGFSDVKFAYKKGFPVLQDAQLKILEGEMAVILGKNGTGKTTLLNLLCGKGHPQEGEIRLMGKTINKLNGNLRGKVGLVMQNPNHQLCMETVYEEIMSSCQNQTRTDDLLNTFRLIALKNRHPYSLSEGEKRRLAVAAVMAADPSVLLLDEPTLGQDKVSLRLMVQAIQEQNFKRKRTVITVTHDREAAMALGQRIFLLSEGRLIELKNERAFSEYFADYCIEKPIQADPPALG
ncbi:MAG: ABC transporter ATP-binding protein [Candidatus Bathyarchaeia archaeon]|jgi:energy-coupling factor transport system ATP-binding protein